MVEYKTTKQIDELLQKADTIKDRYKKAEEQAKVEVEQLKQEIQKAEYDAHDFYKMYVIGDITLEAYQEASNLVEEKKELLSITEGKLASIDSLVKEELTSFYNNEVKPVLKDFRDEDNKNKSEQRKRMFKAKVDYMKVIQESADEIQKTHQYNRLIEQLRVDAGLQKNVYSHLTNVVDNFLSNDFHRTAGLEITRGEVTSVYNNKYISPGVLKEAGLK